MAAQIQGFLIGFIQNPAPSAPAAKDRKIQADLAQVDTDIIAITDALLSGDSAKTASAQGVYAAAVNTTDSDIGVVGSA